MFHLQHLMLLLAAPDLEVVRLALVALMAFVRKTHAASTRFHGHPDLNSRLLAMAQGWGGKEEARLVTSFYHHIISILMSILS